VRELNEKRRRGRAAGHLGLCRPACRAKCFYGNIGSVDRLDFTVVGPAVNETSRIASMCRSVDRPILISSTFADALPRAERANLVSVGRFACAASATAKELFTLDPRPYSVQLARS
jgi:adenylate cyclase